ncbi:MAG: uroporphyrinogen-III C-methyltransferase [Thiomargarita sp.]|nr:uroporphyrinogen-III C-methyltransferase [Thiomargarita sp.]
MRTVRIFIFLFLVLLLGGTLVLSYPIWQKFNASQQKLNAKIVLLQNDIKVLQSQEHKIHFSKQLQHLETDLSRLTHKIETQPAYDDDWKVAEIHYLLNIALHRLQLVHDHKGALAALKAAEERLQRLNKATLFHVRTQILIEIQQLSEIKLPDIAGLSMQLSTVPDLPLLQGIRHNQTRHKKSDDKTSWQNNLLDFAQNIVVIRYNSDATSGFLSPGQRSLVTQILQLKLDTARFFLLRRDSPNFALSIQAVRDWIKAYYDQNDQKLKAVQRSLIDMQLLVLTPPLPDISRSLSLLTAAQTEKSVP